MNGKNIFSEKEGALESQLIKTVGQTRTSRRRPRILSFTEAENNKRTAKVLRHKLLQGAQTRPQGPLLR